MQDFSMIRRRSRSFFSFAMSAFLLLGASAALLGGCGYVHSNILMPDEKGRPVVEKANRWATVQESSHAAADSLANQSPPALLRDVPILVGTLSDINRVETSSALGRMVAEQVGARLVQLGYTVHEIKLRDSVNVYQTLGEPERAGEYVLSRNVMALAGQLSAGAIVSGTYAVARDDVLVNLRMIDPVSGQVLAAHDYAIIRTQGVDDLLHDKRVTFFTRGFDQPSY